MSQTTKWTYPLTQYTYAFQNKKKALAFKMNHSETTASRYYFTHDKEANAAVISKYLRAMITSEGTSYPPKKVSMEKENSKELQSTPCANSENPQSELPAEVGEGEIRQISHSVEIRQISQLN